jgi:TonB-dependent receptor
MSLNTICQPVLRAALLGATMLTGVPALAQSAATEATAAAPAGADDAGDIVVTGFRQSYTSAIASKRVSVEISDGISSDGLGRFPDLNVGEALQRVPGVQINREAEGRNATVNIRGLPGEYSRLTMNGVAFAEPILGDAPPLGAFNSDIFSGIRVTKSPLADSQSGGLSGVIDLQIAPALGRKDNISVKASLEHNSLGSKSSPALTGSFNHHFSDDFAVFGVLAYKRENFRRDSILFNSYLTATAAQAQANVAKLGAYYAPSAACPSCTGTVTTAGVIYNSQLRQYSRYNEGNLWSGAAGAEYRVSDEAKIGITGFYSDRNLPKTNQYLLIVSQAASSGITALSNPVALADGRYVLNDYDYTNADVVSSSRQNAQHQKAWGSNLNFDWTKDSWTVNAVGTISGASNSSIEIGLDNETLPLAAGNGVSGTLHSGAGVLNDFAFSLRPAPAVSFNGIANWGGTALPQAWLDGTTLANSTNRFNYQGTQSYGRNDLAAFQVSVERKFDSAISAIQIGARYEHNKFTSDGYRIMAYGIPIGNIKSSMLITSPGAADFFNGNGGSPTTNWTSMDLPAILSALSPIAVYPGATVSPTGANINYADNNYQLNNFSNQNDLTIAYGQVKYQLELGGVTIRGNAGMRYESTKNKITALDRIRVSSGFGAPSDFTTNTYNNSYHKWLPSFIGIADITDKLTFRAAAYKTYVRPHPRQFSPVTVVAGPTNGVYAVTLGNKDLRPYDATSFDLSLEWYNRPGGIISVAAFQKRVKGLITTISDPKALCPSNAASLGLGTLTVVGDQCQSSLTYVSGGVTTPYLVAATGFVNQDSPITVKGLELNVQQTFDFLPGALKNLGGGFNYAYTTISGKTNTGAKATLPGVSAHNVNIIGFYETNKFGVRTVYNFRSKYDLASAGTFTGAARQVKPRGQLDMSASYNINSHFSLSLDAYNLTDAVRYEYENQPNLPRRFDYDGRTYTLTARASF